MWSNYKYNRRTLTITLCLLALAVGQYLPDIQQQRTRPDYDIHSQLKLVFYWPQKPRSVGLFADQKTNGMILSNKLSLVESTDISLQYMFIKQQPTVFF